MSVRTILTALALAILGGCAHDAIGERNYAGSPGSTYDAALNPPQADGVVTYDAKSPMVPYDYGNRDRGAAAR